MRKIPSRKDADREGIRLLKRHNCPRPFHAVRAFFLGRIASPEIGTQPLQALKDLWGGEMPEFESLDDANELFGELINGLWNRLTEHQSRKHPFRLTALRPPTDIAGLRRFAETRVEELDAFVDGLFGDEEALDLPETAHGVIKILGDIRSFFAGFAQFADDHEAPEDISSTVRNMQELSVIANKEINSAVISCALARRASLEAMQTIAPTRH